MAEHGIANVRVVADRWPPAPARPATAIRADVALIAHIGYDIEAIGPFLDAMEAAADRLCVAVLMDRQPSSVADPFWPPIHGEERVALPALDEFVELLRRPRPRAPRSACFDRPPRGFDSLDELHGFVRRQLWLARRAAPRTAGSASSSGPRPSSATASWSLEQPGPRDRGRDLAPGTVASDRVPPTAT